MAAADTTVARVEFSDVTYRTCCERGALAASVDDVFDVDVDVTRGVVIVGRRLTHGGHEPHHRILSHSHTICYRQTRTHNALSTGVARECRGGRRRRGGAGSPPRLEYQPIWISLWA